MKIVDRKTFLSLPPNTLYCKYVPYVFEDLDIKGETVGNDWYYSTTARGIRLDSETDFTALLDQAVKTGESLDMDFEDEQNDGLHAEGQLFAVFESEDVRALIARLRDCV